MANPAKLRDQARAYELRGQWREAIEAYRELVEGQEGADVDIGTWNRIGDLHLRLNETDRAVGAYEQAVNAYVDVALYNNAIALCRKVLRLVPGRAQTYLRLGQISAAKGFFADASTNFLEYAERMRKAGKLDESFAALKEYADLSPDPAAVRRMLADQLLAHGRRDEAVEQLRLMLGEAGEGEADALREQIRGIDSNASTDPLTREKAAVADELAFDTGQYAPTTAPRAADAGGAPPAGLQAGAGGGDDFGGIEVQPLDGLEHTSLGDEPPASAPSRRAEPQEDFDDLPLISFEGGGGEGAGAPPAREYAAFGEVSLDEEPVDFGMGDSDEEEAEPLPLMDVDATPVRPAAAAPAPTPEPTAAVPLRERLEELRERVAADPEDASLREALVASLHDHGMGHEIPGLLDEIHRTLAQRGNYLAAVGPISALIRLRPGDPQLLQKRVEYAFRSGDREEQVVAYLALGRHFAADGEGPKAEAVFRRVLELDPANAEAREAVSATPPEPAAARPAAAPAAPAAPAALPDDYIDLNALIMGDDAEQGGTRFVVEEREPSGDEDRDFAEMLAHFRQKVSENIEVEDSSSHYDLGLAFKEMGLIDEAIAEFQVALRGGAHTLATLELLGQCFVEKGQYAVAARVLERALRIPNAADADLVGVLYQLGRAEEAMGRGREAIDFYERVLSVDIRFRDANRRIEALRATLAATPL